MIRLVYHFHVYYHVRRVVKRLQTPLPHETSFNAADIPYPESEFFKICEDYGVPNDPIGMKNFIGLISMALVGLMITFVSLTLVC